MMGREVRRVPPDWQHPKRSDGRYVPLFSGSFSYARDTWLEANEKWQEGLCECWTGDAPWGPIPPEHAHLTYAEYGGPMPLEEEFMPLWPAEEATHYMMYEDTTEGTPISPAFETPELLARWLVDNKASSFAYSTASYESWLARAKYE